MDFAGNDDRMANMLRLDDQANAIRKRHVGIGSCVVGGISLFSFANSPLPLPVTPLFFGTAYAATTRLLSKYVRKTRLTSSTVTRSNWATMSSGDRSPCI